MNSEMRDIQLRNTLVDLWSNMNKGMADLRDKYIAQRKINKYSHVRESFLIRGHTKTSSFRYMSETRDLDRFIKELKKLKRLGHKQDVLFVYRTANKDDRVRDVQITSTKYELPNSEQFESLIQSIYRLRAEEIIKNTLYISVFDHLDCKIAKMFMDEEITGDKLKELTESSC